MAINSFEQRIAILEDIEAIKKLKARYCRACDDNHNATEIANLFAADGIWETEGIGAHQGHAALRALFLRFQKEISFSQYFAMNSIIEVHGDTAKGTWYFLGPFTFRDGNRAWWLSGRHEEDYVKVNGEWKFKRLRAIGRMTAPYDTGWAGHPLTRNV